MSKPFRAKGATHTSPSLSRWVRMSGAFGADGLATRHFPLATRRSPSDTRSMWKGRFEKETSDLLKRYGESISYDWRLYACDIRGSIAHAKALARARVLTQTELKAIVKGLSEIGREIAEGVFEFDIDLEDIHMNIEAALTRKIGPAGAKLHTARSRNDQIALDARLYCRDETVIIQKHIRALQKALVELALRHQNVVMPGYTHLQRGQPVLLSHHLLAYVEMLERDHTRLRDARKRVNVMPLGSGALAGSTICLDRQFIAEELDFPDVSQNSMDAVSDRDFVAEILFCLSLAGVHLSRLSEDLVLWVSSEFGFATLSDAHSTGSSLMPQKKNPDPAELTRGKSGRLLGNLVSLLTTLKGLPMTYNRDLQEDKEPLFDSIDTIVDALAVNAEMIRDLQINAKATARATSDPFLLATDMADYLVRKGVPFREAHEVIGKLTAYCVQKGVTYHELPLKVFKHFSPEFEKGIQNVLKVERSLAARKSTGAPSPANVAAQLARWQRKLK